MKKIFAALLSILTAAALAGCDKPAEEQFIDDVAEETSVVTEATETVSETETTVKTSESTETTSETEGTAEETSAITETSYETVSETDNTESSASAVTAAKSSIDITGAWIESEWKEDLFIFAGEYLFMVSLSNDNMESYPYKLNGITITIDGEDAYVEIENEKLLLSHENGDVLLALERYEVSGTPLVAKQQDIIGVWVDTGLYGNFCFINEDSITEFFGATTYSTSYKFDGDKMISDNGDMSAVLFDNKLYLTDEYGTAALERIQPSKPSIADFDGSGYIYKNGENAGYVTFKDGKEAVTDQTPNDYSPAEISINGNKVKFSLLGKTGEYTCYIKSREQEYADKQIFLLNDSDYIVFEKVN